ncbi:MAG TPA: DUF3102 domain-containing protein [Verrucomicrobiae bacterium]|jgi:hypothetical protein
MKTLKKSDRGRRAPLIEVAKLKVLARTIRDGHEATEKLIKSSRDNASDALREAVLTGKALIEVKQIIGFGGFGRWLKEHCKGISERTCQRYVSLYNSLGGKASHVSELPEMNLRKAYLQLGIINEPVIQDKRLRVESNRYEVDEQAHRRAIENYEVTTSASTIVKQLTHETTEAQSSDNESIDKSINGKPIEAEIVTDKSQPGVSSFGPCAEFTRAEHIAKYEASYNALVLDLFNMINSGEFVLAELEKATIEPLRQFFSKSRKHVQTPPPKKESFFQAPANAG